MAASAAVGGDRVEELLLDWDRFGGLDAEQRLSRLSRMVLDASRAEIRYGLALPGQRVPAGAGELHKHRCLGALARFGK